LLGRGVLQTADDGVAKASLVVIDGASEISDFDITLIEEKIFRFKVSVNNTFLMHVF